MKSSNSKAAKNTPYNSLCQSMLLLGLLIPSAAPAQQFMGDNQWTAPLGVSTQIVSVGEEYAQYYFVAALFEGWEFDAQFVHYYDDPRDMTESHTSLNLFAKWRLKENEAQTTGYSLQFGTGLYPEYVDQGQVAGAFDNYWAALSATYGWNDDRVLLDLMPGITFDTDHGDAGATAFGFTYTSRLAIYDVIPIPKTAIVTEVFGTAGEAFAEPSYRVGLRWESPKWILAATYSEAFDGSGGAGFELGLMYFTEPRFCFGGCRR